MVKVYLSRWRVNAVDREGIESRLLPSLGLKHTTTRAAEARLTLKLRLEGQLSMFF